MAQIRIMYQIDNAAFDDTPLPETTRIFAEILESISNGSVGGLIQDINGNGVGSWVIEGHDERYAVKEEEWNPLPLMTYTKGYELGAYDRIYCPNCEDGDIESDGDVTVYTYHCNNCGWEMDVEVKHFVVEVRIP